MKILFVFMMAVSFIGGFWNPFGFGFAAIWGLGYFLLRVSEAGQEYNEMYRERYISRKGEK